MPRIELDHRSRRRRAAAVVMLTLLALSAAIPGQAARQGARALITGEVLGQADGEKLSGATVTLTSADGEEISTSTDKRGRFSLKVSSGEFVVVVEREGYARFEARLPVVAGSEQQITVEMLDAEQGRRSEAVAAYNTALEAYRSGDRAAAEAGFRTAAEIDPTLPEAHSMLARVHLEAGAWREAAAAAESFLAARPEDRQGLLNAYEAYRKLADGERSAELRGRLAGDPELAPKLAVHAFNEGAIAKQGGELATATDRFREALSLDPDLAAAHFALATVEFEAERYAEALPGAERGLALEPASAQGLRLKFLIHDFQGEQEAADAAFDAYAAVDAASAAAVMFQRGEVDFRNGDLEAAIRALGKVVRLMPDHAAAQRVLGLALLTTDAAAAETHLRRFLELAPDDPEAATVEEILANL